MDSGLNLMRYWLNQMAILFLPDYLVLPSFSLGENDFFFGRSVARKFGDQWGTDDRKRRRKRPHTHTRFRCSKTFHNVSPLCFVFCFFLSGFASPKEEPICCFFFLVSWLPFLFTEPTYFRHPVCVCVCVCVLERVSLISEEEGNSRRFQ